MSCYFIAQLSIADISEYSKYLDGFDEVFADYAGEVLAVDESPLILEGDWDHNRIVIIRFPNEAEAKRWYFSEAYQTILQFRKNAANGSVLLVNDRSS